MSIKMMFNDYPRQDKIILYGLSIYTTKTYFSIYENKK